MVEDLSEQVAYDPNRYRHPVFVAPSLRRQARQKTSNHFRRFIPEYLALGTETDHEDDTLELDLDLSELVDTNRWADITESRVMAYHRGTALLYLCSTLSLNQLANSIKNFGKQSAAAHNHIQALAQTIPVPRLMLTPLLS